MSNKISNDNSVPKLKSRVFVERKSLLTQLFETNFSTVKCMLYSVLFGFVGNDLVCGLIFRKDVDYGMRMIKIGFRQFHLTILLWISLFLLNLLVVYSFKLWAIVKLKRPPKFIKIIWDSAFLIGFLTYFCLIYTIPPIIIKRYDIGVVSSCVILLEQIRIGMKAYSFVRSNAPLVNNYKPHSDKEFTLPHLKQYLYFFFAPTLIYRDNYPKTKDINRWFAFICFLEVFTIIWLQSYVMDVFFVRKFEKDVLKMAWSDVFVTIMQSTIGAFLIMITIFYQLLDRWLNAWSELLRFADRKFYEDWWTCTNYAVYLRKWNTVVQDWLFEYVYKEFYENIAPNNRRLAKFMVFLVSAIFHEYAIVFMLDEFFPLLFFQFFVFGQFLTNFYIDSKHPFFNMGMLYSLSFGNSIQLCLYTMELYTRKNCHDSSPWAYYKPRIFNSECISNL